MKEQKKNKLWVVSDVEDTAKDKAKALAKASGKKIGPWLTEFILNGGASNQKRHETEEDSQIVKTLLMKHDETLQKLDESLNKQDEALQKQCENLLVSRDIQDKVGKKTFLSKLFG